MTEEHGQDQTKGPEQSTGSDAEVNAAAGQGGGKPSEAPAPEGATPASDLFDLMGAGGEQFKKPVAKPQPEKKTQARPASSTVAKKYPAGMEIHHAGQKLALQKEMTEAEVFAFLSDDFPEVTADRAEIREDKHKSRLVVAFESFKKG